MRLTCPNCHADYEVPEGMVPAAGRHVQCTSCHTRWFVRGSAAPAASEETILTRLEARSPRPEPRSEPRPEPRPEVIAPAPVVHLRPPKPEDTLPAPPDPQPAVPAVPTAGQLQPLAPAAPRRLDLNPPPVVAARPEPRSSGRFGVGVAAALLLFVLALAAYDFRRDLAAGVPQAAPALAAYHATVDDLRDWIERQFAPLRGQAAALGG